MHPDRRWRGEGRARRGWKEPLMEEYCTPPVPAFLPGFVYRGLSSEMHGFLLICLLTPCKVNYCPGVAESRRDGRRGENEMAFLLLQIVNGDMTLGTWTLVFLGCLWLHNSCHCLN